MSRILSVEYQLPQTWGQFFTSQLSFTNLSLLQEIEVSKNSSPPILSLRKLRDTGTLDRNLMIE